MTQTIAVVDYGSGNLHSVSRAIARVGGSALVTATPARSPRADALVIPGVGHFGACMRAICHHGMDRGDRGRSASPVAPVFGVCVGMQVLFEGKRRGPRARPRRAARARRAAHRRREGAAHGLEHRRPGPRRTPTSTGLPDGTRFYFVHSFAPGVDDDDRGHDRRTARTFAAAVARDNVFATQFHPEKSGDAGLHVYERFVRSLA